MTETDTAGDVRAAAGDWLTRIAGPQAQLHPEQWAAIEALVVERRSVLNVQRTGAGKSAVYWIASALLAAPGAGPALVVSPLLALMRDQVAAAQRAGVNAVTLNSSNVEDWPQLEAELAGGTVDVLLISPERLNSLGFRTRVMPQLAGRLRLLVIDEAHCISSWGHDFRPDYRRLRDVIAALPPGTPVLATTATANERVSADIAEQLGAGTLVLRGSLDRPSLSLSVVRTPSVAHAYAWLADALRHHDGAGIIYTLTVADTSRLTGFLRAQGHEVRAYSSETPPEEREQLEAALRANELRALVATSSLGMGFDKPDLAFVANLGAPGSPVAYYQQVGRAGRGLAQALAVCLPTAADARIHDYFDSTAMPAEPVVRRVLDALEAAAGPLSVPALEAATDLRRGRLEMLLKVLDVDGAVERTTGGYVRTAAPWSYDTPRYTAVAAARSAERRQMADYLAADRCLMRQLRESLDDPAPDCGRCSVCTGVLPAPGAAADEATVRAAEEYLRAQVNELFPRRAWPSGAPRRGRIPAGSQAQPGRALALAEDPWWGSQVTDALAADEPVSADVVAAVVAMLALWGWPAGRPVAVAAMPSRRRGRLLTDLAERVAGRGRLPVAQLLAADGDGWADQAPTSRASVALALSRLRVVGEPPAGPVLLLDDYARTNWTLTVATVLLTEAGSGPVYPCVLHKRL